MATELESRMSAIEREVAHLKTRLDAKHSEGNQWIEQIAETYCSPDAKAAFDKAMSQGRQWRNRQGRGNRAGRRKT